MNSLDSKWATFKKQASGDYVPEEDEEVASRRNFGGSPSRMRSQIKTMIMVLRWHIFVLDLKTVGIHEPPYSWLLRGVKKAPGQRLEINVATLLTNISTEFIAAINGKRTLKLPYITFGLSVFDFLFYMLGLDPTFFSDGSCAPAQTSSQFTAVEFTRHLRKLGCDWEKEVHHDLLPYRGCDEKTKAFVRFICWLNCLQKGDLDSIMARHFLLVKINDWVLQ